MPDWLCPKQVLVCLWELGTDNALWEMAQQTVSHRRALFGRKKRESRDLEPCSTLESWYMGAWESQCAPGKGPLCTGHLRVLPDAGVEALVAPSQTGLCLLPGSGVG